MLSLFDKDKWSFSKNILPLKIMNTRNTDVIDTIALNKLGYKP